MSHIWGVSIWGAAAAPSAPTQDRSSLSHSVNVSHIDLVADLQSSTGGLLSTEETFTLLPKTVWNQFDEQGLLVALSRNKGETNSSYKRRLLTSFVHIANATYRGLVHATTRELGLSLFQPIVINPKLDKNSNQFAPDPYIEIKGAELNLYSDYRNGILDCSIDRYEAGGNYEHLNQLVDFINTTTYFRAELTSSDYKWIKSATLLSQSNRLSATDPAERSTKYKLNHQFIVYGSIYFENNFSTYLQEVDRDYLVVSAGDYYIDYTYGIVTSYNIPADEVGVKYQYNLYPFKPYASPIIFFDINNLSFQRKLFSQILQDDNTFTNGLVNQLGSDIINEILSIYPMYWGV